MWGFLLGRVSLAPVGGSGLRLFTLVSFGAPAPNPANGIRVFSLGPAALLLSLGLRPCGSFSLACGHILILGPAALRLPLSGLRPLLLHVKSVKTAFYQKRGFLSKLRHGRKC